MNTATIVDPVVFANKILQICGLPFIAEREKPPSFEILGCLLHSLDTLKTIEYSLVSAENITSNITANLFTIVICHGNSKLAVTIDEKRKTVMFSLDRINENYNLNETYMRQLVDIEKEPVISPRWVHPNYEKIRRIDLPWELMDQYQNIDKMLECLF